MGACAGAALAAVAPNSDKARAALIRRFMALLLRGGCESRIQEGENARPCLYAVWGRRSDGVHRPGHFMARLPPRKVDYLFTSACYGVLEFGLELTNRSVIYLI